ncbi:hypothetical protein CC86DRAFT_424237 [Ophiobolus disseminans]|uniref:Uncharacterized protein n=1 Tax=Ophiobolus disseminans TaxID=1469910 RepID=A0A6A7AGW7_9PLEO|nr:hypothetical protein CC86DRAFT_424237 [Ophiobolus disseminans]
MSHPTHPFLQILPSNSISYVATQAGDFASLLTLIRDQSSVVAPVTQVQIHSVYDSIANSGAVEFARLYGVGTEIVGGGDEECGDEDDMEDVEDVDVVGDEGPDSDDGVKPPRGIDPEALTLTADNETTVSPSESEESGTLYAGADDVKMAIETGDNGEVGGYKAGIERADDEMDEAGDDESSVSSTGLAQNTAPASAPAADPPVDPFLRVAQNFELAMATFDEDEAPSLDIYLKLLADLLSISLPNLSLSNLSVLVLPREWDHKFMTTGFPMLGMVEWRDAEEAEMVV